jgi:hypothetical protein
MTDRTHQRVASEVVEHMTVIVVPAHDAPVKAHLLDLSASGAGVEMPAEYSARLAEHERVVLVIGAHQLDKPITVPATATYRIAEDSGLRCGFQFVDPAEFMAQLTPALDLLFEQRHWLRVPPDPDAPAVVTLESTQASPEEAPVAAELSDLSGLGVSLDVTAEAVSRFQLANPVKVVMHLPESDDEAALVGLVRHRLPLGDRWRLGIEFDAEATPDFAAQQQRVIAYVTHCRARLSAQ